MHEICVLVEQVLLFRPVAFHMKVTTKKQSYCNPYETVILPKGVGLRKSRVVNKKFESEKVGEPMTPELLSPLGQLRALPTWSRYNSHIFVLEG